MPIKTPCPNSVYHYHVDEGIEPDGNCTFCQIREAEGKMKLEDQVPDFELCQKLRELGMPQGTLWVWRQMSGFATSEWAVKLCHVYGGDYTSKDDIAAPTVAELGEILPKEIEVDGCKYILECWWRPTDAQADYAVVVFCEKHRPFTKYSMFSFRTSDLNLSVVFDYFLDAKEANARAQLLIWCAENGYVEWK